MADHDDDRGPTRAVTAAVIAFGLAVLGAALFAVGYALGWGTQALGASIGLGLGGIGYGLVTWAHRLMPQGPDVEERGALPSDPSTRRRVGEEFLRRGEEIGRRGVLGRALAWAAGAVGLASLVPLASLSPPVVEEFRRTAWSEGERPRLVTDDGSPVRRDGLVAGEVLTVFPEGHVGEADAQAVLIRLPEGITVRDPTTRQWVVDGYLAYSRVCTHAGCPVGLYEAEDHQLFCPCHQSAFDVLEGARPVVGPAARPLPQLPLEIDDDGFLRALGDFPEAVGPGWWTRP